MTETDRIQRENLQLRRALNFQLEEAGKLRKELKYYQEKEGFKINKIFTLSKNSFMGSKILKYLKIAYEEDFFHEDPMKILRALTGIRYNVSLENAVDTFEYFLDFYFQEELDPEIKAQMLSMISKERDTSDFVADREEGPYGLNQEVVNYYEEKHSIYPNLYKFRNDILKCNSLPEAQRKFLEVQSEVDGLGELRESISKWDWRR